jgi:uncharacterized protein (UPF0548 family)
MPKPHKRPQAWFTAARWPIGIALTSWDYMWRTTPMRRHEAQAALPADLAAKLEYPSAVTEKDVQGQEYGHGPLFHRTYRTRMRNSQLSAEQLMTAVKRDLNKPAPTKFARFQRINGGPGSLEIGDEFVVRMPGPWDGPVRVIRLETDSFRLATLTGHLEAGQIEFRALPLGDSELVFEIESWARSSTWVVNALYHRLRMAKEVQAHMWISFLEGVIKLAGGRMTGGIEIQTERLAARDELVQGPPKVRRKLAELSAKELNFDPAALTEASSGTGWTITDLCQPLPGELPGRPIDGGSWEIARRLMRGYEFADPSFVRAYYDPAAPLGARNMLLKLQALGLAYLYVGVRVGEVYERTLRPDGREVKVWGWNYRTLEGHVEMGQMDWEVWKWIDDGTIEFRVHAVSRPAPIRNPFVLVAFRALRKRERQAFLESTKRRMRTFTELALAQEDLHRSIGRAAAALTARPVWSSDAAHDELARNLSDLPVPPPLPQADGGR